MLMEHEYNCKLIWHCRERKLVTESKFFFLFILLNFTQLTFKIESILMSLESDCGDWLCLLMTVCSRLVKSLGHACYLPTLLSLSLSPPPPLSLTRRHTPESVSGEMLSGNQLPAFPTSEKHLQRFFLGSEISLLRPWPFSGRDTTTFRRDPNISSDTRFESKFLYFSLFGIYFSFNWPSKSLQVIFLRKSAEKIMKIVEVLVKN